MAESIAGWREIYPDVTAETAFSMEGPTTALVDTSKGASLVVVGARARGGFPVASAWLDRTRRRSARGVPDRSDPSDGAADR